MSENKPHLLYDRGVGYVVPFILITACFALRGFANDITDPMVKAFSKIFRMSVSDGTLVQVAFYGGCFAMAFPAAMFIRKYSYKAGILFGLALYAFGAAGLIMAILGGPVLPPLQAEIIGRGALFGMPAVNLSFVLPLACLATVAVCGCRTRNLKA